MATTSFGSRIGARALRTRWIARAPITLYRARLGFVFGARLLMLEHTGRHSGQHRRVVLEVVDHPAPDQYIIVSGFGTGAQWYRNIMVEPHVRISVGLRHRVPAIAAPMTEDESALALDHYIERHPRAWAKLRDTIEAATGKPVDRLPMVRLRTSR